MSSERHSHRDAWPTWATAPVEIAAPDPSWSAAGQALVAQLTASLSPWLRGDVHHIGSTAVPELCAKPILDAMTPVASFACVDAIASRLEPVGWHLVPPELDGRGWRRFFVQVEGDTRIAHLHVMDPSHPRWEAQLRFRDRLRENDDLRRQYGALKRQLADRYRDDREAYSAGKSAFVARVLGVAT